MTFHHIQPNHESKWHERTDLVISRLPDDAAASDSEFILVAVDHFRVGSRRADEADAFGVGGQFDSTFAGNCIRRIKDGGAGNRPEHRDVLQRHLRWTVLADRDAGVTADEVAVRHRNGAHSDLVVGAEIEQDDGS